MQTVSSLRYSRALDPRLDAACLEVKRFQARRFEATYADLLESRRYQRAARFFLQELYGEKDYGQRDQQFTRIANTISRLFPAAVVETAITMAEVHALTEQLDDQMSRHWLDHPSSDLPARYVQCWREVGDRQARQRQLQGVLQLGQELDRLTRTRGLRSLLRMMRGPANAARLGSLQVFLEAGFDAFSAMKGASDFLDAVRSRESIWMDRLFDAEAVACGTLLHQLFAVPPPS